MIAPKIFFRSGQLCLQNIAQHISTLYMSFGFITKIILGNNLTFITFGLRTYTKTLKNEIHNYGIIPHSY